METIHRKLTPMPSGALSGLPKDKTNNQQRKYLYAAESSYFIENIFLSYSRMVYLGWELSSCNRIVGLRGLNRLGWCDSIVPEFFVFQKRTDPYVLLSMKLDGFLARRYNMSSVLGTILDPAADKALMTTLTVTLTMQELIPRKSHDLLLRGCIANSYLELPSSSYYNYSRA